MKANPTSPHREQYAALLFDASKLLGAPAHLKTALEALVIGILHHYELSTCLLLVDSGEGVLKVAFSNGVSSAFAQSFNIPMGEGAIGVVFASALPRQIVEPNGKEADPLLHALFQRQRLSAAMIVPLKAEGRVIGTAFYGSQTATSFSEEAMSELSELTDHLALALYNEKRVTDLEKSHHHLEAQMASTVQELSRTNARLVQKVRELKTVYDLALTTAASTRIDEIVRVMISGIKELIEVQGAAFFLFQGSPDTLEPILPAFDLVPADAQKLTCKTDDSPWLAQVVRAREPQILNLINTEEGLPPSWTSIGIRSLLVLPLLQGDVIRGIFCVINKANGLFNQDDVRLLALLTGRVTDVIARIGLDEELRRRVNDLSVLQEINAQLPNPPVLSDTLAAVGGVAPLALVADLGFC